MEHLLTKPLQPIKTGTFEDHLVPLGATQPNKISSNTVCSLSHTYTHTQADTHSPVLWSWFQQQSLRWLEPHDWWAIVRFSPPTGKQRHIQMIREGSELHSVEPARSLNTGFTVSSVKHTVMCILYLYNQRNLFKNYSWRWNIFTINFGELLNAFTIYLLEILFRGYSSATMWCHLCHCSTNSFFPDIKCSCFSLLTQSHLQNITTTAIQCKQFEWKLQWHIYGCLFPIFDQSDGATVMPLPKMW